MKSLLSLSLAATLLAGVASAETTMGLSYGGFEKNDVYVEGLMVDVEGVQNNIGYEATFMDGRITDNQLQTFSAEIDYHGLSFGNVATGPVLSYDAARLGYGDWNDDVAVGWMAKTSWDNIAVKADIQSSTNDFGDDWKVGLATEYSVSEKLTLNADYDYVYYGFDSHQATVGAEYDLTNSLYLTGEATLERSGGTTGQGAAVGLGFRF